MKKNPKTKAVALSISRNNRKKHLRDIKLCRLITHPDKVNPVWDTTKIDVVDTVRGNLVLEMMKWEQALQLPYLANVVRGAEATVDQLRLIRNSGYPESEI